MNSWNKRGLSLMGKIFIINVVMISLFTYKMQVLPLLPLKYVNEIEILLKKYIWDGKRAKLTLGLIKSNKSDGGLSMIDLAIKDMSLKIQWVLMILNDEVIAHITYTFWDAKHWVIIYGNVICYLFMYCLYLNMGFWVDVLYSWAWYN